MILFFTIFTLLFCSYKNQDLVRCSQIEADYSFLKEIKLLRTFLLLQTCKSFVDSIKADISLWLFPIKTNMSRGIALVKLRTFTNVDATAGL